MSSENLSYNTPPSAADSSVSSGLNPFADDENGPGSGKFDSLSHSLLLHDRLRITIILLQKMLRM